MGYQLQRSKRDKTMADKLMYISNVEAQNYPFCRLKLVFELKPFDTRLKKSTKQNSIKVPKIVESTSR